MLVVIANFSRKGSTTLPILIDLPQLCRELGVSRRLLYTWREGSNGSRRSNGTAPNSGCVRRTLLQPRYPGDYRRVTVELRHRRMAVNDKRVLCMVRKDNLLGIEPTAFLATTEWDHDQPVYLNLARR